MMWRHTPLIRNSASSSLFHRLRSTAQACHQGRSGLAAGGRVAVGASLDVYEDGAAGAGGGDGFGEGGGEVGAVADLGGGVQAEGAGQGGQVGLGVGDGLADPGVPGRALALGRDAFLVDDVVVEGGVVGDRDQERKLVVGGGPGGGAAHQEVAVAENRDWQAAGAL